MNEVKISPVLLALAAIILTIFGGYLRDRIATSEAGTRSEVQIEQLQEDYRQLSAQQKMFLTRDEAAIQFRAIDSKLSEISGDLKDLKNAAIDAIRYLQRGEQAPAWWTQARQALLTAPRANTADVQIVVACDIERLVETASGAKNASDRAFCAIP